MTEADPPQPHGFGHLAVWMRDPDFWRDVASRALATAVVAFFAYLFALIGGVFERPATWHIVVGVVLIVAVVLLAFLGGRWTSALTRGKSATVRMPLNVALVVVIAALAVLAALLLAPA